MPEIFESSLFCNSLQYKKSKSHILENPKFIKFNPGGYTFKFTEDHTVQKKRNELYFVPIQEQDICLMHTPPHHLTKGNRNIVIQVI